MQQARARRRMRTGAWAPSAALYAGVGAAVRGTRRAYRHGGGCAPMPMPVLAMGSDTRPELRHRPVCGKHMPGQKSI